MTLGGREGGVFCYAGSVSSCSVCFGLIQHPREKGSRGWASVGCSGAEWSVVGCQGAAGRGLVSAVFGKFGDMTGMVLA